MNKHTYEKAKQFATKAHGDQKYGDFDYTKHLQDVEDVLKEFDQFCTPYMCAAGWLHDTIEDTDITFDKMVDEFGRNLARVVFAVSDEPGKNRKERHERTYPKLRAAGRDAICVKLADRIANVRHSLTYNHGLYKMYQKEYVDFRAYLKMPGELKEMWAALDVLMLYKLED